ncbi:TonB-dependent siderophore receptor [Lentimonas sp. CC11]|uniref:TonB-dependent siderophore receptor n=2 Tax=Lentimonas TaxID=417293 RepID=UPI001389929F|nr:TonB-dependent receptor [Lentimonas sp. CC11]
MCVLLAQGAEEPAFVLPTDDSEVVAPAVDEVAAAPGFVLPDADAEKADAKKQYGEATTPEGEEAFGIDAEFTEPGESEDEESYHILPDFVVSSEKDDGYYSAHSLGGTRTSALIKDTPMTIQVVNQEMMDDLLLYNIDDLTSVLAGVEQNSTTEFNNRSLIFRGLKTADQLYEFMGRELDQDGYNVGRSEIIRGANSLIYGQASPGGKVNFLAKRAEFGKDTTKLGFLIGSDDVYRADFDANRVINDKLAVRVMGVHKESGGYQDYKDFTFDGLTVEATYRVSEKTEVRAHLESVNTERTNPPSMMIDRTDQFGHTGALRDAPATGDFYDHLTRKVKDQMINYRDNLRLNNGNAVPDTRVPDFFTSDADIKKHYNALELDMEDMGELIGKDYYRDNDGYYFLSDVTHTFSDSLKTKLAASYEKSDSYSRTRSGTNGIRFAANGAYNNIGNSNHEYYGLDAGPLPTDEAALDDAIDTIYANAGVDTTWTERIGSDDSTSVRSTTTWATELAGSMQQFLFGIDLDNRRTDLKNKSYYVNDAYTDSNGVVRQPAYRRVGGVWQVVDAENNGTYRERTESYDNLTQLLPTGNMSDVGADSSFNIFDGTDQPGLKYNSGAGQFLTNNKVKTETKSSAYWLANQGRYFDGRLHTLAGIRYDRINAESQNSQVSREGYGSGERVHNTERQWSPSLGALFWLTDSLAVFANYSESIESPTGFQRDPYGNLVPPQIGKGWEGGFKFEALEGKLNGQVVGFVTKKENDVSVYNVNDLKQIYPYQTDPDLWRLDNGEIVWDGNGSHVPDQDVEVKGIEATLYYNPTKSLSMVLSYAYLETEKTKTPLADFGEGDKLEGTIPHTVSFTSRYTFRDGALKGAFCGTTLRYTDSGLYDTIYLTNPDQSRTGDKSEIWLDDSLITTVFVGYGGKIGKAKNAMGYRVQFTCRNIFDEQDLLATSGGGARYTTPRAYALSAALTF